MIQEPITSFDELVEGKTYSIYSEQFKKANICRLICFDTTGLKRPISYWQMTDRGYTPISKERLTEMFKKDQYPHTVFALWNHELKRNIITEID